VNTKIISILVLITITALSGVYSNTQAQDSLLLGQEKMDRYLERKSSLTLKKGLKCTSKTSKIKVIFHRKEGQDQTSVSLYGNLHQYDIFIPYYKGVTSIAVDDSDLLNVSLGFVMKEFNNGEAYSQEFSLNSDKKSLLVKLTSRNLFKKEIIDQEFYKCEL